MGQLFRDIRGDAVRTFVSLVLIVMLVACPHLCRAESLACCADQCEEGGAPGDDSNAPVAPDNKAVSCICAGALKASSRLSCSHQGTRSCATPDSVSLHATLFPLSPSLELVRYGAPPSRAPTTPYRLHLLLQTFRC